MKRESKTWRCQECHHYFSSPRYEPFCFKHRRYQHAFWSWMAAVATLVVLAVAIVMKLTAPPAKPFVVAWSAQAGAVCQADGASWPAREDGVCYREDGRL